MNKKLLANMLSYFQRFIFNHASSTEAQRLNTHFLTTDGRSERVCNTEVCIVCIFAQHG